LVADSLVEVRTTSIDDPAIYRQGQFALPTLLPSSIHQKRRQMRQLGLVHRGRSVLNERSQRMLGPLCERLSSPRNFGWLRSPSIPDCLVVWPIARECRRHQPGRWAQAFLLCFLLWRHNAVGSPRSRVHLGLGFQDRAPLIFRTGIASSTYNAAGWLNRHLVAQ